MLRPNLGLFLCFKLLLIKTKMARRLLNKKQSGYAKSGLLLALGAAFAPFINHVMNQLGFYKKLTDWVNTTYTDQQTSVDNPGTDNSTV